MKLLCSYVRLGLGELTIQKGNSIPAHEFSTVFQGIWIVNQMLVVSGAYKELLVSYFRAVAYGSDVFEHLLENLPCLGSREQC